MFICYPQGKNWFYHGCMEARDHMLWSLKNGRDFERIFIHARTDENPFIPRKSIEDARLELPARLYRTFYLAEFLDDGSVFIGQRDCTYTDRLNVHGERQRWLHPTAAEAQVVIGADWAKTVDYTVFTAIELATGRVVGFERFHKIPYTEAVRRLMLFCRKFKEVDEVLHDKTGLGTVIDDLLGYSELPYVGVTFSNASKADMVAKLITAFEQKMLLIPDWETLLSELDFYDIKTNAIGQPSYGAPAGRHDDAVSSLMLANYSYQRNRDIDLKVEHVGPNEINERASAIVEGDPLAEFYGSLVDDD